MAAATHGSVPVLSGTEFDLVIEQKAVNFTGKKRLNVETIYIDSLVETIKRRLLSGSGFAWMPETAIEAELAAGQLLPIGDEGWRTRLTIAALANPGTFSRQARDLWQAL